METPAQKREAFPEALSRGPGQVSALPHPRGDDLLSPGRILSSPNWTLSPSFQKMLSTQYSGAWEWTVCAGD